MINPVFRLLLAVALLAPSIAVAQRLRGEYESGWTFGGGTICFLSGKTFSYRSSHCFGINETVYGTYTIRNDTIEFFPYDFLPDTLAKYIYFRTYCSEDHEWVDSGKVRVTVRNQTGRTIRNIRAYNDHGFPYYDTLFSLNDMGEIRLDFEREKNSYATSGTVIYKDRRIRCECIQQNSLVIQIETSQHFSDYPPTLVKSGNWLVRPGYDDYAPFVRKRPDRKVKKRDRSRSG